MTGQSLGKFQKMPGVAWLESTASPHVCELFSTEVPVDKETGHRNPAGEFDSGDSVSSAGFSTPTSLASVARIFVFQRLNR